MKTLDVVAQAIYDKKGFNILALDVRNVSSMTDYVIIAEGNIDRHIKALAASIADQLREIGEKPVYVEGEKNGDWIVLDYGAFVIHLFLSDLRDKYSLEELWHEAAIVDLKIALDPDQEKKDK